jgi:hypothetical protein
MVWNTTNIKRINLLKFNLQYKMKIIEYLFYLLGGLFSFIKEIITDSISLIFHNYLRSILNAES